jgi:signal transduction histidine kinase/CheY-like chemotaxis protein
MKISEYFLSPIFDDEEGAKTVASMLKTFLLVAIIMTPVMLLLRLSNEFRFYTADYILAGFFLLFSIYYYLARKEKILLASLLFILTAWSGMAIMAIKSAGIRDVTIIGYIIIIYLATLFNGYRFAVLITVLSLISFWGMAISEHTGLLIPMKDPPLIYARDLSVLIIMTVVTIFLFNRSFRYSYFRIRKELGDRKKAQEELSLNEKKLIVNNIELKRSYEQIKLINEDLIRAKETAEKSDRLKTAFLQNISHEVRTPMNGIVGFAELLRDKETVEEKREEYTKLMTVCTYQLAGVINDLIDISKIEAGDIEIISDNFMVIDLLDDNFENFSRVATEKGIRVDIKNELPDNVIRSDRSKISQILINLMSNAVKFTNKGNIKISFLRSGDNLSIQVSDTGIGIENNLLPVIFDRFRQAKTGLDRPYSGAGLGLAISKGLVDFMEGSIEVDSLAGKGSIFRVSLPVDFSGSRKDLSINEKGTGIVKNLGILIADDDEISSLFLKEILSGQGNILHFARSGEEAVEFISRHERIDIVLMDLKMPGMSGYEAAKIIRKSDPSLPIIAVSAFANEEDRKRASKEDIDDYIVKPVDRKILFSRIEKILSEKKRGV